MIRITRQQDIMTYISAIYCPVLLPGISHVYSQFKSKDNFLNVVMKFSDYLDTQLNYTLRTNIPSKVKTDFKDFHQASDILQSMSLGSDVRFTDTAYLSFQKVLGLYLSELCSLALIYNKCIEDMTKQIPLCEIYPSLPLGFLDTLAALTDQKLTIEKIEFADGDNAVTFHTDKTDNGITTFSCAAMTLKFETFSHNKAAEYFATHNPFEALGSLWDLGVQSLDPSWIHACFSKSRILNRPLYTLARLKEGIFVF